MVRLGITGGIGSGKSYISQILTEMGVPVYDTDSQAKRLMTENESIRADLIALLGENVYEQGRLNKVLLAGYLFASPENALRINKIVHPRVKEDFCRWALRREAEGRKIVAIESAILFEAGFEDVADVTVMVHAPLEVRVVRTIERDHVTAEQVKKRIASQMDDEEKCRRADFIIENDGVRQVEPQLRKLFQALKNRKGGL